MNGCFECWYHVANAQHVCKKRKCKWPAAAQPEGGALGMPGGGAEDRVWSGAELAAIVTTYTQDEFQVEREAGTRVRNLERTVMKIERLKKTGAIWVVFQDARQGLVMSSFKTMLAQLKKDHKSGVLALPCLMSVRSVKCGDGEVVVSLGFPASASHGAVSSLAQPQAARTANDFGGIYGEQKYNLGASMQEQGEHPSSDCLVRRSTLIFPT